MSQHVAVPHVRSRLAMRRMGATGAIRGLAAVRTDPDLPGTASRQRQRPARTDYWRFPRASWAKTRETLSVKIPLIKVELTPQNVSASLVAEIQYTHPLGL